MPWNLTPGKLGHMIDRVLVALKSGTTDTPQAINSSNGAIHTTSVGSQTDPFGWARTGARKVSFEYAGQYDQGLLLWDHSLSGTGAVTFDQYTGSNTLTTGGTASGAKAIRQTHEYHIYLPGRGRSSISGFIFGAQASNLRRRHGMFDSDNGLFLEQTSTGIRFVVRSKSTGSVVDSQIEQADWNIDKFDGTGISGVTIDLTKANGLFIDNVGYNAAKVRFGFFIDGRVQYAHEVNNLNVVASFALGTISLPIRYEIENTGTTAGTNTLKASSCAIYDEDGGSFEIGYNSSANTGASMVGVTTRRPLLNIRQKALFNSMTNRGQMEIRSINAIAKTNDSMFELIRNGTLTGASWVPVGTAVTAGAFVVGTRYAIITVGTTDYTLIGAASNTVGVVFTATGVGSGTGTATVEDSSSEYDVTASAITGGTIVQSGYVFSGQGSSSEGVSIGLLGRLSLTNNFAGNSADTISLVLTSLSGTSNVSAAMNFVEKR